MGLWFPKRERNRQRWISNLRHTKASRCWCPPHLKKWQIASEDRHFRIGYRGPTHSLMLLLQSFWYPSFSERYCDGRLDWFKCFFFVQLVMGCPAPCVDAGCGLQLQFHRTIFFEIAPRRRWSKFVLKNLAVMFLISHYFCSLQDPLVQKTWLCWTFCLV